MGRGRAKAKQTKVARELKYFSPDTDLTALQRELGGSGHTSSGTGGNNRSSPGTARQDDDYDDPYGDVASKYTDYDDEPDSRRRRTG